MKCNNPSCSNEAKAKYCSKSCSATVNNQLSPKRRPEGSCKRCTTSIPTIDTYCPKCREIHRKEQQENSLSVETIAQRKIRNKKAVVSFRQRLKKKAVEYMGGCCSKCNYNKCLAALHFHHLDPDEKDFQISSKSISWEKLVVELNKCVLLCANCHAEEHMTVT